MRALLIVFIVTIGIAGFGIFVRQIRLGRPWRPNGEILALGGVTNFFDTLGVGSFAPTMAWFRLRGLIADRAIPPTMYIGHGLPSIVQAVIFLILLGAHVDPWLLSGCVIAMFAGVVIGIRLVNRIPLRFVRGGIAIALVIAGCFYAATNLGALPANGHATSLSIGEVSIAVAGYFLMGILVNVGVGHYAPSLLMFGLMGLDPHLAFPIMAAAGVLGMSGFGLRYLADPKIDLRVVAGLAFGGIPAVLAAAFLVQSMPLSTLRWLVVVVVLYATIDLLRAAITQPEADLPEAYGT